MRPGKKNMQEHSNKENRKQNKGEKERKKRRKETERKNHAILNVPIACSVLQHRNGADNIQ
jgi:hypothetical protein